MRRVLCVFLVLLSISPFSLLDADSEAVSDISDLRFFEVMPAGEFEGFTLFNYGNETDLKEYTVSDGEGTIVFSESVILGHEEKITLLKAEPDDWFRNGPYIVLGTNGTSSKNFTLNDKGDDMYLMMGDSVIDAFVFGKAVADDGWSGDSFDTIPRYNYAARVSAFDTDSAEDWELRRIGRTDRARITDGYQSTVEPFVFPESSGAPVFNALEKAESEVLVSIYTMNHPDIVSLLISLKEKGVDITILSEGSPAGGVPSNEIGMFALMSDMGIDVRMMNGDNGFRRYTYLHNKYAVIDSKTVIITSENWIESSFEGNRGWGAVIENEDYARYMHDIFIDDSSSDNCDVRSFRDIYPTSIAKVVKGYADRTEESGLRYSAEVIPVISPDYSFPMLRELIAQAEHKVYSEQLEVQNSWISTETDSPLRWMIDAASKGIDSRLIVDTTFDDSDDRSSKDCHGAYSALRDVGLYVKAMKGGDDFALIHNKGLIIDNSVWLGSINWTSNSFEDNREVAVFMNSYEISSYYESYFLKDWGNTFVGEVNLRIRINEPTPTEGRAFILDATDSTVPEGSVFGWDLNDDNVVDRWGNRVPLQLSEGNHNVLLTVTDDLGNEYSSEYLVTVGAAEKDSYDISACIKYVPLLVICVTVLAVKCIIRSRDR
ncbi:MAG: phospholipase D-like domain-containing protein [Candidatus Methanomethylophilaceae archaeon]